MAITLPKRSTLRALAPQPSPGNTPELLTLGEVAKLLKVCPKTVRRIIKRKDIPIARIGTQIRVRSDHVPLFMTKEW